MPPPSKHEINSPIQQRKKQTVIPIAIARKSTLLMQNAPPRGPPKGKPSTRNPRVLPSEERAAGHKEDDERISLLPTALKHLFQSNGVSSALLFSLFLYPRNSRIAISFISSSDDATETKVPLAARYVLGAETANRCASFFFSSRRAINYTYGGCWIMQNSGWAAGFSPHERAEISTYIFDGMAVRCTY